MQVDRSRDPSAIPPERRQEAGAARKSPRLDSPSSFHYVLFKKKRRRGLVCPNYERRGIWVYLFLLHIAASRKRADLRVLQSPRNMLLATQDGNHIHQMHEDRKKRDELR